MGTALLSFENKFLDPKPARLLRFREGLITVHADSTDTGGQYALLEMEGGPGGEPPLHIHRNEDEMFYVLEGELKVCRGGKEITLLPGESAFLPRNVAHTFKVMSRHARFLNYITPGGFEAYFRDLGQPLVAAYPSSSKTEQAFDVAEMIRVAGRYAITFMP
jgi:quercetin dioxygenase-like cupin family protein